ncbi:MAG: aldo/keto reductase [Salinirussus sp.]
MNCLLVGCGAVAREYLAGFEGRDLELAAACDTDRSRAESLAAERGVPAYTDLESMLAAESAPLVVNLTGHRAHAGVTRTCLSADRHVWSEKPLATDPETAASLVDLARSRGLGLGCAPVNHRAETARAARELLADGRLGRVRLAYAHAHVGRVTEWHGDPAAFLAVGPLYDGAVYPLTLLIDWFGPVETVRTADLADPWPDRVDREPAAPTHAEATLSLADGPLLRLTASFYAPHRSREFTSLEFHGDDGSLYVEDAGDLGGSDRPLLAYGRSGREYTPVPVQGPPRSLAYAAGPARLAASVRRGSPARRSARRGAHLVAVVGAIERAADTGDRVAVGGGDSLGGTELTAPLRTPEPEPEPGGTGAGERALRLPPVGMGCSRYRDGEYVDRRDSLRAALDAGYRLFDSAELYGNEHRLGAALAAPGAPDRETLFLVSKVWNTNHAHVREACETTLAELRTESLDCYMLHWPEAWAYTEPLTRLAERPVAEQERLAFPEDEAGNRRTAELPLEDAWASMEGLVEAGLVRSLGICNVTRERLEELCAAATVPPAVVQVERHPYHPRTGLVEWCHERGIRVMAHSPLSAPGLLDDPVVTDVAGAAGASPAQAVLAWNVQRGVVPIPASTDPDHVVDNLGAARLRLPDRSLARLDDLRDPEFER